MALVLAAVLVLTVHALLLGWVPPGAGSGRQAGVEPVFTVRRIERPAAVPEVAAPPTGMPEPTPLPVAAPEPPPAVAGAAVVEAASAPASAVVAAAAPAASASALPVAIAPDNTASDAGSAAAGGEPLPVYATRLPPPARLRYDVRRGALAAEGELVWQPGPERYVANFEASAFSVLVLEWHSEGGYDAAGLAPQRFTDRRQRRSAMSANFRRDQGRITFSGPQVEYPLVAGAQDRLSWLLQLAGIVAADPARFGPGSRIPMFVVGARGDAAIWSFEVQPPEPLDLPAGRVESAWHLRRPAHQPYETEADVWLDPARAWLPARVRLSVPGSGDTLEFQLAAPTGGG